MTTALLYKEFRETLPIGAMALAGFLLMMTSFGSSALPSYFSGPGSGTIPFINDPALAQFTTVAGLLAMGLGFSQSLRDFWGDAQLFLLHRPVSRRRIFGVKLGVGLAMYLACGLLPLVVYAAWAATPGTHASPFEWSMTTDTWKTWMNLTTLYLASFLAGIRPAAWFGTRLLPLAAAGLGTFLSEWTTGWAWPIYVAAADALLAAAIFHTIETRDFV
ncbi:MAG TPA: hypothetical protein VGI40_00920 [Pirellulaceae bacterium]|jgi:hypothetical protein